jgi:WD40 repeat protein
VTSVALSRGAVLAATGGSAGSAQVWNVATGLRQGPNTATGKLAIVAGGGLTYRWQSRAASATVSATGTLTGPATGAADASSVAFGASGTWLVTGDPSGSAQIWESRS